MDTGYTFVLTSVRAVCRNSPVETLSHAVQAIDAFVGQVPTTALTDVLERGNISLVPWVLQAVKNSSSLVHHEKLRQYRLAMSLIPGKMTIREGALKVMKELYELYPSGMDESTVEAVCGMAEMSMLKWLHNREPTLLFKNRWSEDQIFVAASVKGREDVVRWLVNLFPDNVRSLEYAAEGGHLNLIRWLMKYTRWDEESLGRAFENAVVDGHLKVAKFLHKTRVSNGKKVLEPRTKWYLDYRSDVEYELTATEAAASRGHFEMLRWLYMNCPEHLSQREMDYAAKNGHLEIVKFLHTNNAKFTTRTMDHAARNGHLAVMQWLHEHRTEGCTTDAMDFAALHGHLDVLKWLQDHVQQGCTSLAMKNALTENHVEVVKWLHDNQGQEYPDETVDQMAGVGNLEMVSMLHRSGHGGWSKNTMNEAAWYGHLAVVIFLHENRREGCSKHAMNTAAAYNQLEMVKWLHENRKEGCSVLAINNAATEGHLEIVKWLHAKRQEGCSHAAMTGAARNGHVQVMEYLAANFSVNWLRSAMKHAIEKQQLAAVKWLHSHLQPLSQSDAATAARSDNIAVLEFIRRNAEECITSTVYYVGSGKRHCEVVKWYEDHYGNPRKRKTP